MAAWLQDTLALEIPGWLASFLSPTILLGLLALSIVTFIASLLGIPYFLTRLPVDHFSRRDAPLSRSTPHPPHGKKLFFVLLKNLLALVLLVAGLLMLVLPGQALLTLFVALLLLDFPGKHRVESWLVGKPRVFQAINALRRRANKPPLEPRASWSPPEPPSGR